MRYGESVVMTNFESNLKSCTFVNEALRDSSTLQIEMKQGHTIRLLGGFVVGECPFTYVTVLYLYAFVCLAFMIVTQLAKKTIPSHSLVQ